MTEDIQRGKHKTRPEGQQNRSLKGKQMKGNNGENWFSVTVLTSTSYNFCTVMQKVKGTTVLVAVAITFANFIQRCPQCF